MSCTLHFCRDGACHAGLGVLLLQVLHNLVGVGEPEVTAVDDRHLALRLLEQPAPPRAPVSSLHNLVLLAYKLQALRARSAACKPTRPITMLTALRLLHCAHQSGGLATSM
jgi:hypothetical protein